ncbi:Ig-like domain-containing protein [Chamaesiphon sp. OTE_8_metabat_110]|uniref:Ig-like domain-containing protein n=1 Tax=Chamaesiphon sp. OTE_8_metabat_110 TaxID=2964696 RepID=UPI00286A09EE|nr:Ig-like domain-containing protein [Chamaesiphon sp. OTE_8_metabat_110]
MNSSKPSQPIDRIAIIWMVGLSMAIAILLWSGDRTLPQVRDFNWQNRRIGADDIAFTLTFNRQIDRPTVAKQLQITPPLPGKISWAGSRMAYTLTNPAQYGKTYQVSLQGARELIGKTSGKEIVPFSGEFQTPDRMFAYISSGTTDRGRIVIYNFQTKTSQVVTPENLVVTDYKLDRNSQKIVFTATDPQTLANGQPAISSQQVYSITTGLPPRDLSLDASPELLRQRQIVTPGKAELVLDSREYQNVKFDLSPDGNKVVVQRVNRKKPSDFALWVVTLDKSAAPLKLRQSGDFAITPDSSAVAAAVEQQGISILPLTPTPGNNLDFSPEFSSVLGFATDGTAAAMVKYNSDYTRSLFMVNNQGVKQKIFQTNGSIWDAKFSPGKDIIYCLATSLKTQDENSREEPFLTAIDVKTQKILLMTLLPIQQGIQMSLAPDGLAVMFDQIERGDNTNQIVQGNGTGVVWLLPIPPNLREIATPLPADRLPISGWHPRWLS